VSWGSVGHEKINTNATLSFNQQMSQFIVWSSQLSSHASDADNRKDSDPTEAPKHYIDIDVYQDFIINKRIAQTWDSIVMSYGNAFVLDNGILPWATITTYDTLRSCFIRKDWSKAILTAADLGHYVADGHMPLHITQNYNGQLTGNSGIHSRYESTMIGAYNSQIIYSGDTNITVIQNVNKYIFDYIYNNYQYKDSILAADNFAKLAAGGSTSSSTYTFNLWNKTQNFTKLLFINASQSLAELIYTAWVEAGSPEYNTTDIDEYTNEKDKTSLLIYPNPVIKSTSIKLNLNDECKSMVLSIVDSKGKTIEIIKKGNLSKGNYIFEWIPKDISEGIYFCQLKTDSIVKSQKIIYLHE
jgi:hypothetical protein